MSLKECYERLGGNYEAVLQRIPKEEIVLKFVRKFLSEPTYSNLCNALKEENYEEAFRAAHSLKGVSQNLGFDRLAVSSSDLTECLRSRNEKPVDKKECEALFCQVEKDYKVVVDAIRELE